VRLVVDLTDRYVDLVAEGYDLAFRIHSHALEDRASLKVRRLGPFNGGVYASPEYLDRAGRPSRPSDLARHAIVGFVPIGKSLTFTHTDGSRETVAFEPALLTTNMSFVPIALEAGAGVGCVANFIARAVVERGALERVLPEWDAMQSAMLSIVWPGSRQTSRRLRAFLDFTAEQMPAGCL
jgi:DNA-binding transcriptional LysR family regulator